MRTRRQFLRDLGTGLLVAAAPAVAIEPVRKQWFVGVDLAPAGSRDWTGWTTFESSRAIDGSGWWGDDSEFLDRWVDMFGVACRAPDESAGDLRARLLDRYQQPPLQSGFASPDDIRDAMVRAHLRHELMPKLAPDTKLADIGPEVIKRHVLDTVERLRREGVFLDTKLEFTFKG